MPLVGNVSCAHANILKNGLMGFSQTLPAQAQLNEPFSAHYFDNMACFSATSAGETWKIPAVAEHLPFEGNGFNHITPPGPRQHHPGFFLTCPEKADRESLFVLPFLLAPAVPTV